MAIHKNGLPLWAGNSEFLDLWEAARRTWRDPFARLLICEQLLETTGRGEAGREAAALADCLRQSLGDISQAGELDRVGSFSRPRTGWAGGLRQNLVPPSHAHGAIPAIWGALNGWPLSGHVNHADKVARLWLMAPISHRLAIDTWMEMVPVAPSQGQWSSMGMEIGPNQPMPFAFLISKVPVTHAQWEAVWGDRLQDSHPDRPREVRLSSAQAFCDRLHRMTNIPTCLPTEAQWEMAEDGWANNPACSSNDSSLSPRLALGGPNELGLCRGPLHVWEWCSDPWLPREVPREQALQFPSNAVGNVVRRLGSERRGSPSFGGRSTFAFRVIQGIYGWESWRSWDFERGPA